MACYVDDMRAKYGRMRLSHLWADTPGELFQMVDKIGVDRKWFQNSSIPHFDIAETKRQKCISLGAISLIYGNKEWLEAFVKVRSKYKNPQSRKKYLPYLPNDLRKEMKIWIRERKNLS